MLLIDLQEMAKYALKIKVSKTGFALFLCDESGRTKMCLSPQQQDRICATFLLQHVQFLSPVAGRQYPGYSSTANPHALIEIVVADVLVHAH